MTDASGMSAAAPSDTTSTAAPSTDTTAAQSNETCPTCGAAPGTPCRNYIGGVLLGVHVPRLAQHQMHEKARKAKKK